MTRRSDEARRLASLPPKPAAEKTPFTPEECMELREMARLVSARKFEVSQVKGNTALIPNGQRVAEELDAIARLLDNARNLYLSQRLLAHGYPHDAICEVNLETGEVAVKNQAGDNPPAAPAPAPEGKKKKK